MSKTCSDTESSCGWSIFSAEGSDIETWVTEAIEQHEDVGLEHLTAVEAELQDSTLSSGYKDKKCDVLLEDSLGAHTDDNTLHPPEAVGSDHSDIVTLQEVMEVAAVDEASFMGSSCSSQYAFLAIETVFPTGPPAATTNSSSSEDEVNPDVALRRRRVRRNMANGGAESCKEEATTPAEGGQDEERRAERIDIGAARRDGNGNLTCCLLLALAVALSVGVGHHYGSMQVREKQKTERTVQVTEHELDSVMDVLKYHSKSELGQDEMGEQKLLPLLTHVIKNLSEEYNELTFKYNELTFKQKADQAARVALRIQMRRLEEEKQRLTIANQRLQTTLAHEEKSLSALRQALARMRSRKRDLEAENRRLKGELEMKGELELKNEMNEERELASERLRDLETRLEFERQRSDLWERLYLEGKDRQDQRAEGEDVKARQPGIVKETFDAVRNSTKDFVRHQKKRIKNAKEAVKENLRKFSDSVKSTFRHFKDSASTFLYNVKKGSKKNDRYQSHRTKTSGESVYGPENQPDPSNEDGAQRGSFGDGDWAHRPVRADDVHRLLRSYLRREVHHFSHWKELESFVESFFVDGVFVHDRVLFADFVDSLERYLADMPEYRGLFEGVFGDADNLIFRNLFGETPPHGHAPSGPLERPDAHAKDPSRTKQQSRRQQRQRARHHGERRNVKIELGPVPFGPKY
ncbi:cell cycle progression protein 1 [Stigmatopora nigra]